MSISNTKTNDQKYTQILSKNNIKPTIDTFLDFRLTLGEIVKNQPSDKIHLPKIPITPRIGEKPDISQKSMTFSVKNKSVRQSLASLKSRN